MVRTGVTRAYGSGLRRVLERHLGNRLAAFAAGLGVTAVLQSSTATCLMTSSFAGRGLVSAAPALAIMLGADVGTTLVAQVFSFDVSWVSPILIAAGVVVFYATSGKRARNLGRIVLGLGLMLLALGLIVSGSAPIRESETVGTILSALTGEPVLAVLVAALLTWLAHSSLATILLIVSLASAGIASLSLAFALVLGANLGGAMPAILATLRGPPAGRRVAVGNAVFKLAGVVLLLPFLGEIALWLPRIEVEPVRQIVNFHTAFNVGLAVLFIGLTGTIGRLMERLFPEEVAATDDASPRYLDISMISEPTVALASAARETLRMGDTLEEMLRDVIEVFRSDDKSRISDIALMDDTVDDLHEAIKLYLTEISREPLDENESRRCADIMSFTTNLEHVGDIIDKNLLELASKKLKYQLQFSEEGLAEITVLHGRVEENLQLAMNVFVSGDRDLARKLLSEKVHFRDLERQAAEHHHERLRNGMRESIESSSLHLDILRDLKRINSHLTSVAYPILEQAGELRASRLRKRKRSRT
jgi:phosphate:Na+ symporter